MWASVGELNQHGVDAIELRRYADECGALAIPLDRVGYKQRLLQVVCVHGALLSVRDTEPHGGGGDTVLGPWASATVLLCVLKNLNRPPGRAELPTNSLWEGARCSAGASGGGGAFA